MAAASTILSGCGPGGPSLAVVGGPAADCRFGLNSQDWKFLSTHITEFGVDGLRVTSGELQVKSVTLVNPSGAIELAKAALVPRGGVANGFVWGGTQVARAEGWAKRLTPPTTLTPLSSPAGATAGESDSDVWQLVVGVTVSGVGGSAPALSIVYTSNGNTREVVGRQSVGVFKSKRACEELSPPSPS